MQTGMFDDTGWYERFMEFHTKHPEVYEKIMAHVLQAKKRNRKHFSMYMIFEVIRWNEYLEYGDREFKLNNNFRPYYARLVMEKNPDLKGIFNLRQMAGGLL